MCYIDFVNVPLLATPTILKGSASCQNQTYIIPITDDGLLLVSLVVGYSTSPKRRVEAPGFPKMRGA